MFAIQHTLVSSDLLERKFVCDLNACKGACCVKGDAGAPITEEEIGMLEEELVNIIPFMDSEGIHAVERSGVFEFDVDGDMGVTLIDSGRCAFSLIDASGTASCAIEKAYIAGKTTFRKPASCHLYPVRVTSYPAYDAVNYHEVDLCRPACSCGAKFDVPLYRFLKDALIRRFGPEWYAELELIDQQVKLTDQNGPGIDQ